jgi:hypothetical protein
MLDKTGMYAGMNPIAGMMPLNYADLSPPMNQYDNISNNNVRNVAPDILKPVSKMPRDLNDILGIPYEHDDNIDLRDLEEVDLNNLNISGTLGVGEFQDVGTAGAVLTSNGLGAAVSWIAPVYVSARKNIDTVVTLPATTTTYTYINGMTIEFSSGSVYDALTGEFTAPRTAIYIIDYAIHISDDVPIFHEFLSALVSVNRGSGFVREMEQIYNDSGKETKYITLKTTYMTQLNAGDKVKSELEAYSGPANSFLIRGNSFKPRCTFQNIHSIT